MELLRVFYQERFIKLLCIIMQIFFAFSIASALALPKYGSGIPPTGEWPLPQPPAAPQKPTLAEVETLLIEILEYVSNT